MARSAVIAAVAARLAARWTACPVIEINKQGDTPKDGSVFLEVQYPVANTTQMDLTGRCYREEGVIRFIINAARGGGLEQGVVLIDQLEDLFRTKRFGGVQTWAPSSPVIDDRNDAGVYFPVSIAVPYHFDFTDDAGFYA